MYDSSKNGKIACASAGGSMGLAGLAGACSAGCGFVAAPLAGLLSSIGLGTVATVLPSTNLATHTLSARVALANSTMQLLPGMPMIVQFTSPTEVDALLIPNEAVIVTGTGPVVTVYEDDGRFRAVNVEIGAQSDGQTEIRSGLAVGQKVVVFEYLNQVRSPRGANSPAE